MVARSITPSLGVYMWIITRYHLNCKGLDLSSCFFPKPSWISHLLPRLAKDCLVQVPPIPIIRSFMLTNHTTESPTHPHTTPCVYHIPLPNPRGLPSSAQDTHKLSGASFGYSHYVVFFVTMCSLVCIIFTLLLCPLSYYLQFPACTHL